MRAVYLAGAGIAVTVGCLAGVTAGVAQDGAMPRYKLDRGQNHAIEISNLPGVEGCEPGRIEGVVVKRKFDEKLGTLLTGFTLEERGGGRTFINVDFEPDKMNRVTAGWVDEGLQTMLRVGNSVSVGVGYCGAAGRVVVAESIRLRPRRR